MTQKWYVIFFLEDDPDAEDSCDIVSKTWFTDQSKSKVYWPAHVEDEEERDLLIRNHHLPDKDWKIMNVELFVSKAFSKYNQKMTNCKNHNKIFIVIFLLASYIEALEAAGIQQNIGTIQKRPRTILESIKKRGMQGIQTDLNLL